VFLKVFDKVSGVADARSSEKLRLMIDSDLSPAMQEKLKVAFAEGYLAHLSKPGGSSVLKWLRYIVTSVFIMTVALLIFNILINTATGGSIPVQQILVCVMLLSCFMFFFQADHHAMKVYEGWLWLQCWFFHSCAILPRCEFRKLTKINVVSSNSLFL
jgi:hypothetical protein